jgi:hypothetical protein
MITLKVKSKIKPAEFAAFLAATIDGNADNQYFHLTNTIDTMNYSVGQGNDWWVKFEDDHKTFSLTYRYQCDTVKAEEALVAWLIYRLDAIIVEKT